MADRLVQQHTGPAGAEHHRQRAGGSGNRLQVDQRLAQRLAGVAHGPILMLVQLFEEEAIVGAPAAAMAAPFATAVLLDDHADVEAHQRADVGTQAAVAGGDQHLVPDAGQADRDLLDARIQRAGGAVDALEQLHLGGALQHVERVVMGIQVTHLRRGKRLHPALLPGPRDRTGGAAGGAQRRLVDGVAVGEAGLLAGLGAHADTLVEMEAAFLDDAVLENPGLGHQRLEVQVGGIDARPRQLAQQARQVFDAQAARRQQTLTDRQ